MSKQLTPELSPAHDVAGYSAGPGIDISLIPEGESLSGKALEKMGSSIPTPFARLHLFSGAFREVFQKASQASPIEHDTINPGNNHKLVSLALDMLEFIYKYGADEAFEIHTWNAAAEAGEDGHLEMSMDPHHHKLAKALDHAWKSGRYGTGVHIFTMNGEIIGGTSPLSLVYTSPNIKGSYTGVDNKPLFSAESADIRALHQRSVEFRKFMHALVNTYGVNMLFNGVNIPLRDYVMQSYQRYEFTGVADNAQDVQLWTNMFNALNYGAQDQLFRASYEQMKNGQQLSVSFCMGVPMMCRKPKDQNHTSDYVIKPTRDAWKNYTEGGVPKVMDTPLVLSYAGVENGRYLNDSFWNPNDYKDAEAEAAKHPKLQDRVLVGVHVKKPFIIASDFLEEKIVEVGFNINGDKFFTAKAGDCTFMLPLKRVFFDYFAPEDIRKMMSLETAKNDMDEVTEVKVRLTVPVTGGEIILEKNYKGDEIIHSDDQAWLNMAFFPFFIDEAPTAVNRYQVMLGARGQKVSAKFYKEGYPEPLEVDQCERTSLTDFDSTHYAVQEVFELIEMTVDGAECVVVPKMTRIPDKSRSPFTFCIDFGTTNTHIAYFNSGAHTPDPQTFTIAEAGERQTVLLSADKGMDFTTDFRKEYALREFVPLEMQKDYFPIRTAICEVPDLKGANVYKLFSTANVGFHFSDELNAQDNQGFSYKTELKWDASDARAQDRMKIFFAEMLWLMRNKALLNGGAADFKLVVTYPQVMYGGLLARFKQKWNDAAEMVKFDPKNITYDLESIAPYYSFCSQQTSLCGTYVNIDIGGGSTDILYNNPMPGGEKCTYSVRFAANDLWGNGCNKLNSSIVNGFLNAYEDSSFFKQLDNKQLQDYKSYKMISRSGADVVSFLFKHNNIYRFSDAVQGSPLISLLLLHFTSLMYYLGEILLVHDLNAPRYISFTGMGSLYLKILSPDAENLNALANAVLNHVAGGKDSNINVNVQFADHPKHVTAAGGIALTKAIDLGIEKIHPQHATVFCVEEEDSESRIILWQVRDKVHRKYILNLYKDMIEMMSKDKAYRNAVNRLGLMSELNKLLANNGIEGSFAMSFDDMTDEALRINKGNNDNDEMEETLFFWPLKNALFELGMKMAPTKKTESK